MVKLIYEHITVSVSDTLTEWENLKNTNRGWPVVVGNDGDMERLTEQFYIDELAVSAGIQGSRVRAPSQILADAANIRFPYDLSKWSGAYLPEDLHAPLGEWPANVDGGDPGLSVAINRASNSPHDRVHILLLPIKNSWEAPAFLRWGNWNACPPAEYHVAALREWHNRFGVDLVGINGDTMNLKTKTRPEDREQAVALARDMYGYCPDIVDQGVGSIAVLAAGLMTWDWWYLWWD